ncbi:MAG: hypothetical protein JXR54_09940 [Tannerellaceae bacterium]|nr:hypothetical protein [Tannerellaceae bacterium]
MSKMSSGYRNDSYYKSKEKRSGHSNVNINPSYKDKKEYMLSWVEHIYSAFLKKKTWMGNDYNDIPIMRAYMEGNQPVDQYRDFLYGSPKNENTKAIDGDGWDVRNQDSSDKADRIAWVNIDEKPVSIGPKIMTKLLEQSRNVSYEVGVNAIDSMSTGQEDMAEARLWFEKENREYLNGQRAMLGIQAQEPDFMPLNANELELYKNSGGFKVPWAVANELLLQHSFEVSNWEKEVQEKVLKDLASIRYSMVREYYDPEEKRIKVKYCDPEFSGLQFSRDFSFTDSEYGFELEEWPISKVRQKFDLTHEEAASLAFANSNYLGNPSSKYWDTYGYYDFDNDSFGFDFYKVNVFRCEWIDIDNEKYYKHTTKNGKVFNKPLKNKDPEGLEVYDSPKRYVREATWIAGTKYLCNYGKLNFIPRPNPRKPRLSYRGIRLAVPALFQQIRPLLNGLTQSWWKTQEAIGIAVSNGFAVDVGALKNVSVGKDKSWDVLKVIEYYRQRGILFHKKSNPLNFGGGGGASPITPLQTRMHENILAQFDMMNKFMGMIESISGINLVATGDTPEPRIGKFNMQVALQGTDQIIGSIIRAATELQSDVGLNIVSRIRMLCKASESIRKSYAGVIGEHKMKELMMAEKSAVEYGVKIEARDVEEMKAFIDAVLAEAVKSNSGEGALLDLSEVILIRDMIVQKQNMRMISFTLGYILRKKGKEREAAKLRAIEAQGQQLQNVEKVKEQNAQKARMFEMHKMKKQFEYDYYLANGKYPSDIMNAARKDIPAEQANMGQPPVPPQMGEQPPVAEQEQAANV